MPYRVATGQPLTNADGTRGCLSLRRMSAMLGLAVWSLIVLASPLATSADEPLLNAMLGNLSCIRLLVEIEKGVSEFYAELQNALLVGVRARLPRLKVDTDMLSRCNSTL